MKGQQTGVTNTRHSHAFNASNRIEMRTPRVDLFESGEGYYLRISLPGVKKEDVRLHFSHDHILEIKGIVRPLIPEDTYNRTVTREIFQGPFQRKVKFEHPVDKKTIHFDYRAGVLEIYLNKMMNNFT